jgi:hypothetical protein
MKVVPAYEPCCGRRLEREGGEGGDLIRGRRSLPKEQTGLGTALYNKNQVYFGDQTHPD